MPNVPGLAPISDPSQLGRFSSGRLAVPDQTPDAPALRPVAAPVDTYSRPAVPDQDNALTDLARSLLPFNTSLDKFAAVKAEVDHSDIPGKVAAARLSSKNDAEFQLKLQAEPGLQDRFAQRLGMKQLGLSTADTSAQAIVQDYQTGGFDKDRGDLEGWLAQKAAADLKAHGDDPSYASGYFDRMTAVKTMLQSNLTTYRTEQAVKGQDDNIFGGMLATVNSGSDTSVDPSKVVATLQDQFRANQVVLAKSPQDQARLQLTLMDHLKDKIADDPTRAAYYTQVIAGLANADRTGLDGKSRGSLLNDPDVGGKVSDVVRLAQGANQKQANLAGVDDITKLHELARTGDPGFADELARQRAADPKRYDQNAITSLSLAHETAVRHSQGLLARQQQAASAEQAQTNVTTQALVAGNAGQLHLLEPQTVLDASGKPSVVSVDDQIKNATTAKLDQIKRHEAQTGDTQSGFAQRVSWFTQNPSAVDEEWKRTLRSGPSAVTASVAADGTGLPQSLADGYALHKRLAAVAPGVAFAHEDGPSRDLYERARVAEEYQRLPERAALALAARATTDANFGNDAPSIARPKFDQGMKSRLSQWFGKDVTDTANQQEAFGDAYRMADNIVRGNTVGWDDAMDIAAEAVKKNYTVVNGVAVRTVDKRVPADFGAVANRYFDGYWQAHQEQLEAHGLHRDDLSMAAVGTGNAWRIVDRHHVADPGIPDATITLGDLYKTSQAMEEERQQSERETLAQTQDDKLRNFFYRTQLVKGQVDRGAAITIGGGGFMGKLRARQFLQDSMTNPDYAAGKALDDKAKAAALAVKQQTEMREKQGVDAAADVVPGL